MKSADGYEERRRTRRRRGATEHGIVSARVRPGHEVRIIDVSAGGALIESDRRLLPGAAIDLQLATDHWRAAVRGHVLRCAVARLRAARVSYHGAIAFDRQLPWFGDEEGTGYTVPTDETRPRPAGREDATR